MKKKLAYTFLSITAVIFIGGGYAYSKVMEEVENSTITVSEKFPKPQGFIPMDNPDSKTDGVTVEYSVVSKIGGSKVDLPINENSTEGEVIQAMHEMTHQKVVADAKWGAIPLTKDNAEKVYNIIDNSNFKYKDQLLDIAYRWKDGDFSTILGDHNYFWELQGGGVGKATEVMDRSLEQTFVLNNFGDDVAAEMTRDGDLIKH